MLHLILPHILLWWPSLLLPLRGLPLVWVFSRKKSHLLKLCCQEQNRRDCGEFNNNLWLEQTWTCNFNTISYFFLMSGLRGHRADVLTMVIELNHFSWHTLVEKHGTIVCWPSFVYVLKVSKANLFISLRDLHPFSVWSGHSVQSDFFLKLPPEGLR